MKGGDSSGLRAYNVRLIVSEIRAAGALSKADIARRTGLSGQSASVIVNTLLQDGILRKKDKIRGQVGQPSTPIALHPRGAYAIGLKIGRRSLEVMLVNFLGERVANRAEAYGAPYPDQTMARATELIREAADELPRSDRDRIVGLGVAMPGDLHEWARELGLPADALAGWRPRDVGAEITAATGHDALIYNDATAACASEMLAGHAIDTQSALYIYIGTFVGGGVVIGGRLHLGSRQNAGAIGSIPLGAPSGDGPPAQLIERASAHHLERALDAAGLDGAGELAGGVTKAGTAVFEVWSQAAIPALAQAVVAATGVVDFETVVVDGFLPQPWRRRVVAGLEEEVERFNRTGLSPVAIREGSIGPAARVIGAALLPLIERFSPDTDLLVNQPSVTSHS